MKGGRCFVVKSHVIIQHAFQSSNPTPQAINVIITKAKSLYKISSKAICRRHGLSQCLTVPTAQGQGIRNMPTHRFDMDRAHSIRDSLAVPDFHSTTRHWHLPHMVETGANKRLQNGRATRPKSGSSMPLRHVNYTTATMSTLLETSTLSRVNSRRIPC